MAFVVGIIMGLIDATVEAWSAKAYAWAFVLGFYALLIAYEFIVMQTPPRPLLQAFLFVVVAPMGILSGHHITLLAVRAALGELPTSLPLSPLTPSIYVSLGEYLTLTGVMLAIYAALVMLANLRSCD
jgi:hypothetical protein